MSAKHEAVLVVGGTGVVGTRAVRALRRLQPELPITLGVRDVERGASLARELGGAEAVAVDLERADLGLPHGASFGAVVPLVKDYTLNTLRFAHERRAGYVAFSDFAFEMAPAVALHVHARSPSAFLFLGQVLGGTVTLATLHFARGLERVDSIALGIVLDEDDGGGPSAHGDAARVALAGPRAPVLHDGRWQFAEGALSTRQFTGGDGTPREGHAFPLLDVASLAACTGARNVRLDFAVRSRVERRDPALLSHEVIVEIEGARSDGTPLLLRHVLSHDDIHAAPSALGAALAVERLLGLAGGNKVGPGLYNPEQLLEPAYVMKRLQEFGTRVTTG